jgi:4-carboxymuconolactone decarboxylase
VRASLAAGLDQATIDAINERRTPPLNDPREKSAHDVARELLAEHRLSDATYAAAEKAYGIEGLVSLVAAVGQFSMVSCTANAFDITPPDDAPSRLAP